MNGKNEEAVKGIKSRAAKARQEAQVAPAEAQAEPKPGRQNAPPKPAAQLQIPFAISDDNSLQGIYAERMIEAAENLRVELRAVTPQWAEEVLATRNTRNRKMGAHNVSRLESVLDEDRWEVNGDTIVFDIEDILVNGQNRLQAIANSGITVPCIIVYGVSRRAFQTLDTQKRRSPADVLSIEGHGYTTTLSSALAWQMAYDNQRMTDYDARKMGTDMVLGLLAKHPGMSDSVQWARNHRVVNCPLSPSLIAFFHYNLAKVDKESAENFLVSMLEGLGVEEGSHMHLLRRRLANLSAGTKGHHEYVTMAAVIIKTWNRVRRNEPSPGKDGFIGWRNDERFPEIQWD